MKKMNRREFLTLTGAAVVALSLAGCGGGSYAPPAPPAAPTGKEAKVLEAINLFRKEKGWGKLEVDSILNVAAEKYAEFASGTGEGDEETLVDTVIRLDSTRGGQYVHLALTLPDDLRPYDDDVDKMKNDLLTRNPTYVPVTSPDPEKFTLVGIKVFTYPHDGKEYWYAVAAERKN